MTLTEQCEYDASGALRVASAALRVDRASRAVRSRDRVIPAPRPAAGGRITINDASSRRGGRPTVNTGVPTLSRLDPRPCAGPAATPRRRGTLPLARTCNVGSVLAFELQKRITSY